MDKTDIFPCEEWNSDYILACKIGGRVVLDICGEDGALVDIYLSMPQADKFARQILEICGEDNGKSKG